MKYIQDQIEDWKKQLNPVDCIETQMAKGWPVKGCHFVFDKYTVSVQWGAGNYCDNYDRFDYEAIPPKSTTAELAIWENGSDEGLLPLWESESPVTGHVSVDDVFKILVSVKANVLPTVAPEDE